MEVDRPAIEQAAGGAPAAPPVSAAGDRLQLDSSTTTAPGQFIACMKVMYRRVPPETMLNRRVCACCIWLYGFRSGARWRWSSTSRLNQVHAVRPLRHSVAWASVTPTWRWPQVQASLPIHDRTRPICCRCCYSRRIAGVVRACCSDSAPSSPPSSP
jgi:hypothetical protein